MKIFCSMNQMRSTATTAFVCEKCAPTFEYYGWFMTAKEIKRRSDEIYERT